MTIAWVVGFGFLALHPPILSAMPEVQIPDFLEKSGISPSQVKLNKPPKPSDSASAAAKADRMRNRCIFCSLKMKRKLPTSSELG